MKKFTLKEKYEYNKKKKGLFSSGYCEGVDIYLDYGTADDYDKKFIKSMIDYEKRRAAGGSENAKGFMCGIRDAARDRKSKR